MAITISNATPANIASSLSARGSKAKYLVIYASLDGEGRSWCGDCRNAEGFINEKFEGEGLDVVVVYAGGRDEWRSPGNVWRKEPFEIRALPTLVKVFDGKWERLVEGDVYDHVKLDEFVGDGVER